MKWIDFSIHWPNNRKFFWWRWRPSCQKEYAFLCQSKKRWKKLRNYAKINDSYVIDTELEYSDQGFSSLWENWEAFWWLVTAAFFLLAMIQTMYLSVKRINISDVMFYVCISMIARIQMLKSDLIVPHVCENTELIKLHSLCHDPRPIS